MNQPYVYADFNGIEYLSPDRSEAILDLSGYGTLASLARQRIRLAEGMALMLFEPNDLEVLGTAHFDSCRRAPNGGVGAWVARIDATSIRPSVHPAEPSKEHLCIGCGLNLYQHLSVSGRMFQESCPACGVSILAPLSPPGAAT